MKSNLVKIFATPLLIVTFFACETKDTIVETPEEDINNYSTINYTELSQAPFYKQSTILCKFNDDLYRFGTTQPTQVFNLTTKTWNEIPLPDSSYSRWDGLSLRIGDYIYIVAISVNGNSYDILKYNPITNEYIHTGTELPRNFYYPAFCSYNNQIVFLSMKTDSVFSYDVEKNHLTKIAVNPFYNENVQNNSMLASGFNQDYFYVFRKMDGYYLEKNQLYRLNLNTNMWEELIIPQSIENKYLFGGSTSENMVLFSDTTSAYLYSFETNVWSKDTAKVPIFERLPNGDRAWFEWSFNTDGSDLYGSEVFFRKIWRISVE